MSRPDDSARDTRKSVIRAFVRANHPDVGGDTAAFILGLESLRGKGITTAGGGAPTDACGDSAPDDPRFDAPIVVVARPAGLRGLPARFAQWRFRRSRPPRVR